MIFDYYEYDDSVSTSAFKQLSEPAQQLVRPSMRIVRHPRSVKFFALGESRIGGIPDLPPGFVWPTYEGLSQSFVAQFNLSDLADHAADLGFPTEGTLAFFYAQQRTWGFESADHGSAAVFNFPDSQLSLVRTDTPCDVPEIARYQCAALEYIEQPTLPDSDTLHCAELDEAEKELVDEVKRLQHLEFGRPDYPLHRLGGHPYCMQHPMEEQLEAVTSRIDVGRVDTTATIQGPPSSPRDWRMLLQLDSDEYFGMDWWVGCIYYWIREQDLAARNFDRVWLMLQGT